MFWPCCTACKIFVPQWGITPAPPAVEVWIPKHWTTRKLSLFDFNKSHLNDHMWLVASIYWTVQVQSWWSWSWNVSSSWCIYYMEIFSFSLFIYSFISVWTHGFLHLKVGIIFLYYWFCYKIDLWFFFFFWVFFFPGRVILYNSAMRVIYFISFSKFHKFTFSLQGNWLFLLYIWEF